MSNARMQLKELCDRHMWALTYEDVEHDGPLHAPSFSVRAVCREPTGGVIVMSGLGNGSTIKGAQEAACQAALGETWADPNAADVQAFDSVGDATIDFLINLLGHRAELTSQQIDGVRQAAASNASLATLVPPMASTHTAATAVEAAVGREVALVWDQLMEILGPAAERANAGLMPLLEAAVAQA